MAKDTKSKNKNSSNTIRNVAIFGGAVILVAVLVFSAFVLIRQYQLAKEGEKDNASDTNTASEILKTEEDLKDEDKVAQSSNDAKDRFEEDEDRKAATTVEQDASGLNIAKPELSYVAEENGFIVAGGAITNINETEGSCTYVFTKDGAKVTQTAGILPNANYISCEAVRVEKSKFTSGTWTVKIQYKSNKSEGESETQTITIQ
jgi:cytoskeletal protein RodZ